jgi:hypothetical protein
VSPGGTGATSSGRHHDCRWSVGEIGRQVVLVLENRWLRVTVLPEKGVDISEFRFKPTDTDVLWKSPWSDAAAATPVAAGGGDNEFLDTYHGGWQEMFPICGAAADYGGGRIGVHGEACLLPWRWTVEVDEPERVTIRFDVATVWSPFRLCKRLSLRADVAALFIAERVTNDGADELPFMWGQHPALGAPFLKAGCRIDTDARTILTSGAHADPRSRLAPDQRTSWPHARGVDGGTVDLRWVAGPEEGSHDWAYLTDFEAGWFAVTEPDEGVGFGCRWPAEVLPFALYWQNYRGARDAPWFGRAYTVALEPQSTFPADFARGAPLLRLRPRESLDLDIVAVAFQRDEPVYGIDADGVVA